MTTEEKIDLTDRQVQHDAFKQEFEKALLGLMGKIRYRGTSHHEWIADQIARHVSEDPLLHRHLLDLLRKYNEQEQISA